MTELRAFAERVLLQPDLGEKLRPNRTPFTDAAPGEPLVAEAPVRSPELKPDADGGADRMPKRAALRDPAARGVAHHLMANHELQALEIMAATLLKHPDAPPSFRLGMATIMLDEQRHTRMHAARAARHGCPFGSRPVSALIWRRSRQFDGLLDYCAGLPLVFEGANLDHTIAFAEAFESFGDPKSAHVMRQIHDDEIEHVQFGIDWLRRLKPDGMTDWDAFVEHLVDPLEPRNARGGVFQEQARRDAGLDDDFVNRIRDAVGSATSKAASQPRARHAAPLSRESA